MDKKMKPLWGTDRPTKRSDCLGRPRPCPWIGCKHHLIWENKKILKGKSDTQIVNIISKMEISCFLDACSTTLTLDEIGKIMGLTRERVRQIESGKSSKGGAMGRLRHPKRIGIFKEFQKDD